MTLTVWPFAVPRLALESRSDSSGATRENGPDCGAWGLTPNAIPVANSRTRPRRLPHAALWRSPRPAGFRDFCVRTINLTLSFLTGKRSSFVPRQVLQARNQSLRGKSLILNALHSMDES